MSVAWLPAATAHTWQTGLGGDTEHSTVGTNKASQTHDTRHFSPAVSRWELPRASLGNDCKVRHWAQDRQQLLQEADILRSKRLF